MSVANQDFSAFAIKAYQRYIPRDNALIMNGREIGFQDPVTAVFLGRTLNAIRVKRSRLRNSGRNRVLERRRQRSRRLHG